jgi:DtxR family Mn-dependent transcriptional regulator
MPDPRLALLIFFILVLTAVALFWPRGGMVPRLARLVRMTERVRVEDALKHLYDCETRGVACTMASLAGTLEIGRGRALRILGRLQALGLTISTDQGFALSDAGRSYALRILRTHRLVERFLADRTGIAPGEWHAEAERLEHRLSEAETERLARRIGHPVYDPHGDPIPTAAGVMPEVIGSPLSSVPAGGAVTIVHLEDEPPEVYELLLGIGLSIDQTLRVTEATPERIRFTSGGRESALAATLARNVTVVPLAAPVAEETGRTLADLAVGQHAEVVGISLACQGPQRRRLLDLGVVPGTVISAVMASAAGDPIAYDIRGAMIGLRRQQAGWIRVRRIDPARDEAA